MSLLADYLKIARVDHWIKNIFVLPGFLVAVAIDPARRHALDPLRTVEGLLAVCLASSSNYVLNELLDAPADRLHPHKASRPAASGRVNRIAGYAEWLLLIAAAVALGLAVSRTFTLTLVALWLAGCAYNVPPLRTKDVPYLDVISEAVNNPIRMLSGWYLTLTEAAPIASLLASYWLAGCYLMAIKRFAEFRELAPEVLARYRRPFAFYSERGLLTSIVFYGASTMLFLGAFIVRYRLELVLSFPLIAAVMAVYFWLSFQPRSPVQNPERLYREPWLMAFVLLCAAAMAALLFIDVPLLHRMFVPTQAGP